MNRHTNDDTRAVIPERGTLAPQPKPWRRNVMALAGALLAVAVLAATGSAFTAPIEGMETVSNSLAGLALISTTALATFGKDILQLDSQPFDQEQAEHEYRLSELDLERHKVETLAALGESAAQLQIDLTRAYRRGQIAALEAMEAREGEYLEAPPAAPGRA